MYIILYQCVSIITTQHNFKPLCVKSLCVKLYFLLTRHLVPAKTKEIGELQVPCFELENYVTKGIFCKYQEQIVVFYLVFMV